MTCQTALELGGARRMSGDACIARFTESPAKGRVRSPVP